MRLTTGAMTEEGEALRLDTMLPLVFRCGCHRYRSRVYVVLGAWKPTHYCCYSVNVKRVP
jgi:hypothetical protein